MNECTQVGGQAVLEGVMMRSPNCLAVAVRRPDGQIALKEDVWRSLWDRLKFLRWPFLRGTVVMAEAMANGMQALNFSAREAMPEEETSNSGGAGDRAAFALTMLVGLLIVVVLFKGLPHLAASYFGFLTADRMLTVNDLLYHVVDGVVKVLIFIGYIAGIGLAKDIRRVYMYHGAEHMAIHTYEAGEELTVSNASGKNRLHPRCGTAFLMVVILVFIAVAAITMPYLPSWAKPEPGGPWWRHVLLVLFKLPLLIPVAGLAYEFNRFAGRNSDRVWLKPLIWPGMMMQLLTTRQPTDDQLEIALAALRTTLWRETVGASGVDGDEEPLVFEDFDSFVASVSDLRPQVAGG